MVNRKYHRKPGVKVIPPEAGQAECTIITENLLRMLAVAGDLTQEKLSWHATQAAAWHYAFEDYFRAIGANHSIFGIPIFYDSDRYIGEEGDIQLWDDTGCIAVLGERINRPLIEKEK